MNLNKVLIIGNLTRDPELKTLPSGTAVASFGVATNRVWKDQNGAKKEDVQFHNIVAFGRQGEVVNQYSKKGSMIFIEGRLQTRDWEGQDGKKNYRTEIVAERIQLGPRSGGAARGPQGDAPAKDDAANMPVIDLNADEIKAEDLPF
ncbi:MAG: hypothetical protein A3B23_02735 [Candidatus Colwellbacteria bacterium RIFCSPLOWO2_01_FULL_48_10]|uniref:Single-stranded DNA-binding protein n=1 Tax=Candidatus Colwellbacteria bacterium RIFCSPLOWO2_01_FULL_48_10 TaxID=1797690 RepID=A0A1G1Z3Y1_9BACT|nr:MAG: hypothetical protein A3B23_02735 [Candidatus Colwellbacteria bacterium RIFCSPLOWO2_01_FULL_48_10]